MSKSYSSAVDPHGAQRVEDRLEEIALRREAKQEALPEDPRLRRARHLDVEPDHEHEPHIIRGLN